VRDTLNVGRSVATPPPSRPLRTDNLRRLIGANGGTHGSGRGGGDHGAGLGHRRGGGDRTIARRHQCRRLRIRWEIRDDIREAFLNRAAALICWRPLTR
jgi:hypothetical protein